MHDATTGAPDDENAPIPVIAEDWLLESQNLSSDAKVVYLRLLSIAGTTKGSEWLEIASRQELSEELRIPARTLDARIRELRENSLIDRIRGARGIGVRRGAPDPHWSTANIGDTGAEGSSQTEGDTYIDQKRMIDKRPSVDDGSLDPAKLWAEVSKPIPERQLTAEELVNHYLDLLQRNFPGSVPLARKQRRELRRFLISNHPAVAKRLIEKAILEWGATKNHFGIRMPFPTPEILKRYAVSLIKYFRLDLKAWNQFRFNLERLRYEEKYGCPMPRRLSIGERAMPV